MNLRMRKLEVEARAAGAASELLKGCGCEAAQRPANPVALLTSAMAGHQHMVRLWPGDAYAGAGGSTSDATSTDAEHGHYHAWVMNADGTITIGESEGHSHVVDLPVLLLGPR